MSEHIVGLKYCRWRLHYFLFPTLSPSSLSLSPVATDPTIVSLAQVSATTVRVEWSQPSGEASVTGYVVHYSSNDVTNFIPGLPSSATSHKITGLTNCGTYSISVEAISEQLSGESGALTLCELVSSYIITHTNLHKINTVMYTYIHSLAHNTNTAHTHSDFPSSSRGCECE